MAKKLKLQLEKKMQIAFGAVLEIERAPTEAESILAALAALERLGYPNVLISFLHTSNSKRFLLADPKFAVGDKWKQAAAQTNRSFDQAEDILARVLQRGKSRFVADSRNDPLGEFDQALYSQVGLVSQYVMPLRTDSVMIGAMQLDMGELVTQPMLECTMLDALAAHLSVAIERHRVLADYERVNNELLNQTKLVVFEAATAQIMHELMHAIGDYAHQLNSAIRNPKFQTNKEVVDFLMATKARVAHWVSAIEANVKNLKSDEPFGPQEIEQLVRETVSIWYPKAARRGCALHTSCNTRGKKVHGKASIIREMLSCLIINAIEANARRVDVIARCEDKLPEHQIGGESIQLMVTDDGVGIPREFQPSLGKLGWTSKAKGGHGMGLTIVDLLAKKMGGKLELVSLGRSAGENKTAFVLRLPVPLEKGDYGR